MRPLTDRTPKPLLTVAGTPLIDRHLRALAHAGMTSVVVNLSWLGAQIRAHLGDGARYGVHVQYSEEGPEPLETGGGIFRALPLLGPDPFLVINGDVWTDYPLGQLNAARVRESDAHLVLVPNPPQHPRGDFALSAAHVCEDGEPRLTYSGIGLFRPEFFSSCSDGRFPLLPLFRRAIARGRLTGEAYEGQWSDIGTPERLASLDSRVRIESSA